MQIPPKPVISIRKAVKEDCARMLELIHELAVYEKEPDAVTVSFAHFAESGFGEKPVWEAFVATIPATGAEGETIIGFALWYIRYSTWKGQRMYLEDLLVTESMRGQGIGKLLFDRLIEECREKNTAAWFGRCWNGMNRLLIFIKNMMPHSIRAG